MCERAKIILIILLAIFPAIAALAQSSPDKVVLYDADKKMIGEWEINKGDTFKITPMDADSGSVSVLDDNRSLGAGQEVLQTIDGVKKCVAVLGSDPTKHVEFSVSGKEQLVLYSDETGISLNGKPVLIDSINSPDRVLDAALLGEISSRSRVTQENFSQAQDPQYSGEMAAQPKAAPIPLKKQQNN